jgi:hypothetical protein
VLNAVTKQFRLANKGASVLVCSSTDKEPRYQLLPVLLQNIFGNCDHSLRYSSYLFFLLFFCGGGGTGHSYNVDRFEE